jgi:FixJ family two-component response regulator
MQSVHSDTNIAIVPRQYRNRPNPRALDSPVAEPLCDVVYFVGDDPFLREQISTRMSNPGTKVLGFQSAKQCLDFAGRDAAACVVIDSSLRDMCGLELQCRLASTSNPPVIFVSDGCDVPLTVCAMKAGAIDFLTKPFELSALIASIRTGLAQDRRLRQRRAELARLEGRLRLLTPREREVLPLVIGGLLNKQAACLLGISEVTLQIHRSQVMRKMEAESLAELVRMALKLRISHWREQPNMSSRTQ